MARYSELDSKSINSNMPKQFSKDRNVKNFARKFNEFIIANVCILKEGGIFSVFSDCKSLI